MKTILAASLVALMSSSAALAESADILQLVGGVQEALNEIDDVTSAVGVTQEAVNAANLVSLVDAGGLDEIAQGSWLEQDAENSIDSGGSYIWWSWHPDYAVIKDVTQSATNVANSVSLGTDVVDAPEGALYLDEIKQGAFVDQYATNDIETAYTVEDVSQSAVNAANLISVDVATSELKDIVQFAVGDQDAYNTIVFKKSIDGNATEVVGEATVVIPSTQSATNVVNSVSVQSVSKTLAQFSAVEQDAKNVADSVGSNSNVWDFNQTAVNATNLVSIGAINDTLDISQVAFASQEASNLLDANGTVEQVVQSATNVANSIGSLD
ncbi:hypothetical protein [Rhizobium sp. AAP43]|uniref:hypothetical protein n=1 Tax=Rhizobium sp. AAP43 TaxID=1523420 RepID=UPI000ABABB38|nr:hypothetical protein [Rhizobium sp. AAP43]